jgi:hypothetical protein
MDHCDIPQQIFLCEGFEVISFGDEYLNLTRFDVLSGGQYMPT